MKKTRAMLMEMIHKRVHQKVIVVVGGGGVGELRAEFRWQTTASRVD